MSGSTVSTLCLLVLVSIPAFADDASNAAVVARATKLQADAAKAEDDKTFPPARLAIKAANDAVTAAAEARAHAAAASKAAAAAAANSASAAASAAQAKAHADAAQKAADAHDCETAKAEAAKAAEAYEAAKVAYQAVYAAKGEASAEAGKASGPARAADAAAKAAGEAARTARTSAAAAAQIADAAAAAFAAAFGASLTMSDVGKATSDGNIPYSAATYPFQLAASGNVQDANKAAGEANAAATEAEIAAARADSAAKGAADAVKAANDAVARNDLALRNAIKATDSAQDSAKAAKTAADACKPLVDACVCSCADVERFNRGLFTGDKESVACVKACAQKEQCLPPKTGTATTQAPTDGKTTPKTGAANDGPGFNPVPPGPAPPPGSGVGDDNPERQVVEGPIDACPACGDIAKQLAAKEAEIQDLQSQLDRLGMMGPVLRAEYEHRLTDADREKLRQSLELDFKLFAAKDEAAKLKAALDACQTGKCPPGTSFFKNLDHTEWDWYFVVERVNNILGNNPFNPQNPLGSQVGVSPGTPGACTASQPPPDTQMVSCPAGQTGTITQTRSYICVGTTWTPGSFVTTGNTCTGTPPMCTGPQPPPDTQTLACPAGQTGSIIQMRTYSCVGSTWTPGPFVTTSNTCTTPPPPPSGCATNFSTGNYSCSGQCGISSTMLNVNPGSASMSANPFGANSNVGFTCSGASAASQSNNLMILGQPGHSCTLSGLSLTSFGIMCRNNGGGMCNSSCSR